MTQNVSTEWSRNVGVNLVGTSTTGAFAGAVIPETNGAGVNGLVTVCLPFILTAIAGTAPTRYIPAFGRDALRFRIYLESLVAAFSSAGAPVIQIEEPEAIMYVVELSPSAQSLVNAMTGGVYNILCSDYRTANGSFTGAAAPLTTVQTLGFSVSSLERVIVVHRDNASVVQTNNSIGARVQPTLQEYQLLINGQSFPERPILYQGMGTAAAPNNPPALASSGAETLAETLVAQHALSDFSHLSQFNMGAASVLGKFALGGLAVAAGGNEAATGTFVCAIELESAQSGQSFSIVVFMVLLLLLRMTCPSSPRTLSFSLWI